MKDKRIFTGAATALVTPMNPNGGIDYTSFEGLIEKQIDGGIDALLVLGTTGEASTLSDYEKQSLIEFAIDKVGGRVPVIVGTGTNDTSRTAELSKYAADAGADALLVVTPYYNKATESGLVRHYLTVADAVRVPIIVYNVPSRTGVNVGISVYRELVRHENIRAVKEASGNVSLAADILSEFGGRLDIYSGCDDLTLPILALGGCGVISVLSNVIPRDVHDLCDRFIRGDKDAARRMQLSQISLCRAMFSEVNPIPIKRACEIMGICSSHARLPLTEISERNEKKLRTAMEAYGLI
ncbi:MAG: 4-hydroxy-tetrahydrodipicolinate synthase [Clostridia bacterium]|nr:4-hydroxy-tetrahydrodipicolinate synthase [Clostridia bacterium]